MQWYTHNIIDSVEFYSKTNHRSFSNEINAANRTQIECKRTEIGLNQIKIKINLRTHFGAEPIVFTHTPCLQVKGQWRTETIQINKYKLKKYFPDFPLEE